MAEDVTEPAAELGLLDECRGNLEVAQAEIEHLKTALVSARRIGAAIGILMARRGVTDDDAFQLLSQASQRSNRKVRDVSEDVLYTGDLAG